MATPCCQKININGLGVVGLALLEDDGWKDIALLDDIDSLRRYM